MNKRKEIPLQKITPSKISVSDFFDNGTIERTVELFDNLNLPIFKRNQTGINHRFLNWWTKENVIDKNVSEAGRFTFTELIWIKTAEQLRLFNLPLPFIATLKATLFEPLKLKGFVSKTEQAKQFISDLGISETEKKKLIDLVLTENKESTHTGINLFQLIIIDSLLNRKPISLAIFPNCEFLVVDKTKQHLYSQSDLDLLDKANYIKLSISNLLSEYLKSDLAFTSLPKIQVLSYSENKLFEVLHTGEYDLIILQFNDKKQKVLELKNVATTKQKVLDLLSTDDLAEIIVRKHKGIITKVEQPQNITF